MTDDGCVLAEIEPAQKNLKKIIEQTINLEKKF